MRRTARSYPLPSRCKTLAKSEQQREWPLQSDLASPERRVAMPVRFTHGVADEPPPVPFRSRPTRLALSNCRRYSGQSGRALDRSPHRSLPAQSAARLAWPLGLRINRQPNHSYRTGRRNSVRKVDEIRPPMITMAIGYSISCPGRFPRATRGSSASPVLEAVMRIGASRSEAPRTTSCLLTGIASSC